MPQTSLIVLSSKNVRIKSFLSMYKVTAHLQKQLLCQWVFMCYHGSQTGEGNYIKERWESDSEMNSEETRIMTQAKGNVSQ